MDFASAMALFGTAAVAAAVVIWLARHAPHQSAELEARLPALTPEEQRAVREGVRQDAERARLQGEAPDEGALLERALREARMVKFRLGQRPY